ncbi:11077_t:CDS:2, partial [Racocetra persica]
FHSPYSFPETPNLNLTSSNKMAKALKTLTNSIDKLITQLQDQQRPPSRSRSENFTPSTVMCFTCSHTGHYSRNCPDLPNNRNSSANNQPPKKVNWNKNNYVIDLEEGESTKDPDVEMEEVYEDHEGQELQDLVTQNQYQNQEESVELLEVKKVEPPKINKKKEDVKDEIMIEERDIRRMNEEIILYDKGPVAGLISAQEEDNRSISDLFDYYYEKGSCSNIKYNIGEVEDNQRKQLLELLRENPDLCAQDISELGWTDIIRHYIPTQDVWPIRQQSY